MSSSLSSKESLSTWHCRLSHPSLHVFRHLLCSLKLSFPLDHISNFSSNSCNINKSTKLPFHQSIISSSVPLEVIYSDVWTSSVLSSDGFKYYVIFVDHYTKYIWLYPLSRKSDVHITFLNFKALVENYFSTSIKILFTDNGGEYLAMRSFLATCGITRLTTPPHTPEHNSYSEGRHRHIVETGLTLLHRASLPILFWPYAIAAAIYLINRILFWPYVSKLRVFGCLCYPWLRPYSFHKLDPKSIACVFLGYSLNQSAFVCLDPSTNRTYVSRHVRFVETIFLFSQSHTLSNSANSTTSLPLDSWIPLPPYVPLSYARSLHTTPQSSMIDSHSLASPLQSTTFQTPPSPLSTQNTSLSLSRSLPSMTDHTSLPPLAEPSPCPPLQPPNPTNTTI